MGNIWHGLKAAMLMVVVQVVFVGVHVSYKLAANDGMSLRFIVAYRFLIVAAVMVPLALIVERKRPKLTWTVFFQAFFVCYLGLLWPTELLNRNPWLRPMMALGHG